MSTLTRTERNANFMAWDTVVVEGVFTPSAPVEWKHFMSSALSTALSFRPPANVLATPDDDIAAGRIRRFDDIEEMLNELKSAD